MTSPTPQLSEDVEKRLIDLIWKCYQNPNNRKEGEEGWWIMVNGDKLVQTIYSECQKAREEEREKTIKECAIKFKDELLFLRELYMKINHIKESEE